MAPKSVNYDIRQHDQRHKSQSMEFPNCSGVIECEWKQLAAEQNRQLTLQSTITSKIHLHQVLPVLDSPTSKSAESSDNTEFMPNPKDPGGCFCKPAPMCPMRTYKDVVLSPQPLSCPPSHSSPVLFRQTRSKVQLKAKNTQSKTAALGCKKAALFAQSGENHCPQWGERLNSTWRISSVTITTLRCGIILDTNFVWKRPP